MKIGIPFRFWLGSALVGPVVAALAVFGYAMFPENVDASRARARFTPPEALAQSALEAALRSWQKGMPPGRIAGPDDPGVMLVDNCRLPGQTLEKFTILGESNGEGPRCFAVRVVLRNPDEEQRLRFVVMGVDPLWVYRYEDFEMMIHWDCGREEREKRAALVKKIEEAKKSEE